MDKRCSDELYISYFFPPSDDVSGITVFKRIVEDGKKVDILQTNHDSSNSQFDEYINNRISIDISCRLDWAVCIFDFMKKGIQAIDHDYEKIYSRSWPMSNHFLAAQYKFTHPDTHWRAEFSDPLIFNLSNEPKTYNEMVIQDNEYVDAVNKQIAAFNDKNDASFPQVEYDPSAYFTAEYLVYLFADEIIFTNENQREIMLRQFPIDVMDLVMEKSEIKPHPTLPDEYYHLEKADLKLDDDYINIAYFGKDYYAQRHFESLFYALESLNHKFKDKIRIHLFIKQDSLLKSVISVLDTSKHFTIHKPLKYFEFLNATTQFDVLIVNDVFTQDNYEINPYLPSKLSDYLGSGRDIWAFYEKGSSLSKRDLKYKSNLLDLNECTNQLAQILKDYGWDDEDSSIDSNCYYHRLTSLNQLIEKLHNQNRRLSGEVKKLKEQNEDLLSSNSWKVTKPLRKFRKYKKGD